LNYLAHIYLSGCHPDIQVGGLLGDFVKGSLTGQLPTAVETGIRLHRHIDTATDSHPLFCRVLATMPSPWRRFGGILMDVYFDHLLASRWHQFHDEPLPLFCGQFYRQLQLHSANLPPRAQDFCRVAPQVKWLEGYADRDNLPLMLNNIGRRFRNPVPLADALCELNAREALLESCFESLMAEHRRFAQDFLNHSP